MITYIMYIHIVVKPAVLVLFPVAMTTHPDLQLQNLEGLGHVTSIIRSTEQTMQANNGSATCLHAGPSLGNGATHFQDGASHLNAIKKNPS